MSSRAGSRCGAPRVRRRCRRRSANGNDLVEGIIRTLKEQFIQSQDFANPAERQEALARWHHNRGRVSRRESERRTTQLPAPERLGRRGAHP